MNNQRFLSVLLCVLLLVLSVLTSSCSKKGTPARETAEVLYIGMVHYSADPPLSRIYVYNTSNWGLVDSLDVEELPIVMEASPDGKWLYYIGLDSYDLLKVSARTGSVSWRRAIPGVLRLIGNGTLLIGGGADEESGAIVDQESGSTISLLPDTLLLGFGPEWGTEVAAIVNEEIGEFSLDSIVTVLDCKTGATRGRFVPYMAGRPMESVYHARLHPDGERVLVIGRVAGGAGPETWFAVGSMETGETVFALELNSPPFGETAIAPNGDEAVVSDPAEPGRGGGSTINLISLEQYGQLASFGFNPPSGLQMGSVRYSICTGQVIIAPGPPPFGAHPLILVDPQQMSISDTIWLPDCDTLYFECPYIGAIALGKVDTDNVPCE